jgi:hypothetical protein
LLSDGDEKDRLIVRTDEALEDASALFAFLTKVGSLEKAHFLLVIILVG